GSIFLENRFQRAQAVNGGVRTRRLVGIKENGIAFTLWNRDGKDLVSKFSSADCRYGFAMTAERVLVLAFARYAILFRDDFTGISHVVVFIRVPESVLNHRIDDGPVAEAVALAGVGQQIRRIAHALHAAGHDDFGIAGMDGLCRKTNGLEA